VVEAQIPDRHQALDGLLVDLLERAVALLVVAHPIGQNVVGRAAVTVLLEIVERLRGGAGAEQKQDTRSRCEDLHERRSLTSYRSGPFAAARPLGRLAPTSLKTTIKHPRPPSRALNSSEECGLPMHNRTMLPARKVRWEHAHSQSGRAGVGRARCRAHLRRD